MGVVGLIFELHPPSSGNQCNFCRSRNDAFIQVLLITGYKLTKKPKALRPISKTSP